MFRAISGLMASFLVLVGLAGCNSGPGVAPVPTEPATAPVESTTVPMDTAGATQGGASTVTTTTYPRLGHADDYSWIAGWVSVTGIQGGCIYIRTDQHPEPTPTPGGEGTISGPVVGTAERSDTSPPLSEITPVVPGTVIRPPDTGIFVPGGPGWDPSDYQDGDYIVAFGRLAGAGDTLEMCPGGSHYVIDRVQMNP